MEKIKDIYIINRDTFLRLGIDPQEAIDYLLNKQAIHMDAVHIKAVQVLKQMPLVHSS